MKKRSQLWILIIIGVLSLLLLGYALVMFMVFVPYKSHQKSKILEIPYGASSKQIAKILKDHDIIRNQSCFLIYLKSTHQQTKLRAGAFLFPNPINLHQVVENLINENGAARLTRVTIPEGYTIWNIGQLLEKKKLISYHVFVEYAHNRARYELKEEFPFLKGSPVTTIEGYLFPDTYLFSPGSTPQMITRTMLQTFEKRVMPVWKEANANAQNPGQMLSLNETVILASLIEKEAASQTEMQTISSVFYNRLRKKMKLASDPTVVYALGMSYKSKVLYKDLEINSPYNTYKYSGLPKGPIASPGLAAFKAAIQPQKTDFLFFVADKKGGHFFTKTYKEHLQAQKVKLKKQK